MPTHAGPNIVGESNLIFAYDTGDISNSYKGEPTTNLLAAAGSDAALTRSGTSYPYYAVDINSVVQSNWSPSNNTLTISYEGKRDYSVGGTGGGGDGYPVFYVYFTDWSWAATLDIYTYDWSYNKTTFTMPNPSGKYVYFSIYHMNAGNPGRSYSRNHQIEFKSHATQFINGTRSVTEGLLPLISNSSLNLSNVSFDSNAQITFDGTDDYIDTNSANLISGTNPFTIEAVTNKTSGDYGAIIGNYGSGYDNLWFATAGLYLGGACYHSNYSTSMAGWHYSAVTRDESGNVVLYRDGIQSNTAVLTKSVSTNINWRIGADVNGAGEAITGNIPLVKIYNRVLTPTEIQQNYQQYKTRFNLN